MPLKVCIIGGGAAGVGLLWAMAKATQTHQAPDQYEITLLHDQNKLGGHSWSYQVPGTNYWIDLGVQMIAPVMYPNVMSMLHLPEMNGVTTQAVPLKVSCAFPPDATGATPYWGNFAAYQTTPLWQQGAADCTAFEALLLSQPFILATVRRFLEANRPAFQSLQDLRTFFLDPYMSIMNGYGAALLDDLFVPEIGFLFDKKLASFSDFSNNFARFKNGSQSWIDAMAAFAQQQFGADLTIGLNSKVLELYPDGSGATVVWDDGQGAQTETFDTVVSTIDMASAGDILNNANNPMWDFYSDFVGQSVWGLIPGVCYLHTDASMLAPGMPNPPEETLQFTAYWATSGAPYNLEESFTTFIYKNLMGVSDPSFNYYLTMYGYYPTATTKLPDPTKVVVGPLNWTHGMWLPSFMWSQKQVFHTVQSSGQHYPAYPGQRDTKIFFAGNNLTMDSEEGAFVSALAIADYAFGISPSLGLGLGAFNSTTICGTRALYGALQRHVPGLGRRHHEPWPLALTRGGVALTNDPRATRLERSLTIDTRQVARQRALPCSGEIATDPP